MKKKQRAVTAEGQGEGGGQAPPPRDMAAPAGDGWDDDERSFFARGEAVETGEVPPETDDAWPVGEGGWRGLVTSPRAAVVSIGVILAAGLWLLGG